MHTHHQSYTVLVGGFKGGVGKTTTALHLAGYLAQHGKTVLLDSDPLRCALQWINVDPERVWPFSALHTDDLVSPPTGQRYLVLDTQAREEELLELLPQAHLMVLPTKPDRMSVQALIDLLSRPRLRPHIGRTLVLICDAPRYPSLEGIQAKELFAEAGYPTYDGEIRSASGVRRAMLEGCLLGQVKRDKGAKLAQMDYDNFGRTVLSTLANLSTLNTREMAI